MSGCAEPKCRPEIGCDLGEDDLKNCPNWRAAARRSAAPDSEVNKAEIQESVLPWSGNAFGLEALSFVAGRSNPTVVAIVGPYNSGKTTLLAAWYLLATRGLFPARMRFSGSYTLGGWEAISHRLRWSENAGPTFPAHTPVGGRHPGMLHLAYRSEDTGIVSDYLFVDAAGEWYRSWSISEEAPDAAGARWATANADLFLILADSESLAGQDRGDARQTLQLILDRLGSVLDGRPLGLVWSKADLNPTPEMKQAIREAAQLAAPDCPEFEVSVFPETDEDLVSRRFLEVLAWTTQQTRRLVAQSAHALQTTHALGPYGRSFSHG